jgi:uncharacterized phage protein (predicted DNA packaging)
MIELGVVKQHLRVEGDHEDALVEVYLAAAVDAAERYIGRKLYVDQVPEDEEQGLVITPSITAAILLITGHLYENREEVIAGTTATRLPMASESLLWPYRLDIGL